MERITEVDLEIGGIELFLEDLAELCNVYGIVITGCDAACGIAVIEETERRIERYELHAGHILPIYTESAKVV